MTIPREITAQHILAALRIIDAEGIPKRNQATKFALKADGKLYPPKLVICKAALLATGQALSVSQFSGGKESNDRLTRLGFEVIELEANDGN